MTRPGAPSVAVGHRAAWVSAHMKNPARGGAFDISMVLGAESNEPVPNDSRGYMRFISLPTLLYQSCQVGGQ